MFSFIRNFSATKFYSAVQSGSLTGGQPHTIGALFSLQSVVDFDAAFANAMAIFGNAVFGTTGTGIRVTAPAATGGKIEVASGTINLVFGTAELVADGTYGLDPEGDLINLSRANIRSEVIAGADGTAEFPNVKPNEMIFVVMVQGATNVDVFVNGHHAAQVTAAPATNAAEFRIGIEGGGTTQFADGVDIAGVFYEGTAMTEANIRAMLEAAQQAEDIVDPTLMNSAALVPDYIWSVKRGNPTGLANWASTGTATAINMVRNGTWLDADFYAAKRPWYSTGS